MSNIYQNLNIDLEMGTKYLINESAYFLGGIFAANESVTAKGQKYWIAPVRHNNVYLTNAELESHFQHVKALATKLSNNTLMASTIKKNQLDSGKFNRLVGFGTFFKTTGTVDIIDMIPDVKRALLASTNEVKRCFIAGMFDGRGSIDINKNKGTIRYIVLDCENETVGRFLCEVVDDYGLSYNYNQARERLEGGKPRKDQLRIPGSEDFIKKIGLISDKKFSVAASVYDNTIYKTRDENHILDGLKSIERR
ncbi:hypothetical protein [Clostridium sp. VAP23]|uniref:hypothetical protein n=1 Tax=Clostridium sp. VAP23 TaxID=2949981 RepID=UPI00207964D2|nr:hypothetical protein [Clostridium sp. VAP23]